MRDSEEGTTPRETLMFENDRGAGRAKWLAILLILALVGWMGSGFVLPSEDADDQAQIAETDDAKAMTVAVRRSAARTVPMTFLAEGQALPDRDTQVRAETSGEISEVLTRKGALLSAGAIIAKFDPAERVSAMNRAQEALAQAQEQFDNAQALFERGATTAERVMETRADLAAAQASLSAAEEAMDTTIIQAPFDGRLEELDVDPGEIVQAGQAVARLVDTDPLTVAIQIPQQSMSGIRTGQKAMVKFFTGETAEGEVTFVGSAADAQTRTFLAELTVPNPDGAIPAGVSAQVAIPTGEAVAHFLSPAMLSLDTDGTLGIKTVDADNIVRFSRIEIVSAETDGIWVSGLPQDADIITIGQGFVNDGEPVRPQLEEPVE